MLLYLAGTVASFFVLRGSRRGRIIVGVVALFTVTASVMGLFAFFNLALEIGWAAAGAQCLYERA